MALAQHSDTQAPAALHRPRHFPERTEWPTLVLALCIYGGWALLTFFHARLPWWVLLPAGSWLIAWHMSLQHEVLHGHPTRHRWINDAIGFVPLALWLPYARYRAQHLSHHDGLSLTDPVQDPESYYITAERLRRSAAPIRLLRRACNTLLGRLALGPALSISAFLCGELRIVLRDGAARRTWAMHAIAVGLILAWLILVCRMPLAHYVLLFLYPGMALALLRSFAEHRAAEAHDHRTAIVENTPVLGLLFLYNNLHVVHHLRPGLPWYRIPAAYRVDRDAILRLNGGLIYDGYLDVARRFLLRQHDSLAHPETPDLTNDGSTCATRTGWRPAAARSTS